MPVQTELKVQEVITKEPEGRSQAQPLKNLLPAPALPLPPPGCVGLGRPVSNLHIFFHLGPSHPDERTEWQTGRQTAVSPVQACTERTSTRTHSLDPSPPSPHPWSSQSPGEGPNGKGCQQQDHFIHFICFGVGFSFQLYLDGRVSETIEGVLFVWLVLSGPKTKEMSFPCRVY